MSTFTLQDLNLPTNAEEAVARVPILNISDGGRTVQYQQTPPQMGEVLPNPTLESILKTIGEQFALLSTVIGGVGTNTTPPEGNPPSLQETVSLTLQQAEWFKEMVGARVDEFDFEAYAQDAVKDVVESAVENYFSYSFNVEEHFDFADAVSNEVYDRIDDAVADKIDSAVEEYMNGATISISK